MIKQVNLVDICKPKQWKTIASSKLLDKGYPVYGANGKIGYYSEYTHEFPTVLITCRGATCGTVNISEPKSYVNGNAMALDDLDSSVELKYLFHVLNMRGFNDVISGSAQPQITRQNLKNLKIPLPPLAEQQKIAAILDAADSLRQKDEQLVEHYTALSQSLFLEMFGDPVTNPMGWAVSRVGDVLANKTQNGLYLTKDKYQENGVEMVHMSDAFYGVVSPGKLKKVVLTKAELDKYRLSKFDLLLARRSLTYEGAAKPCRIPDYSDHLVYESSLIRITPKIDLVNTMYLYYFFSNERARNKYVNQYITKSTISGINNKALNAIEILLPSIELQNQFEDKIKLIEAQKQQAQVSLIQSEALFNSLLHRAFTGELTGETKAA